jgi:formate transporter
MAAPETLPSSDARPPREIAHLVEQAGVTKANTDALTLFVLAGLAGAFISLGGLLFTVIVTGSTLGFGLTRLVGGVGFSLGLILTVIAGAELFTGNNLIAMAWASGLIGLRKVLRNWVIVYAGNVLGALATVQLVLWADTALLGGGEVGRTAVTIATGKVALPLAVVFARGILCNALVCLAVWLAMGGRTVADRIAAIVFPITAFVTMGFEHSIANWFFLPLGMALAPAGAIGREAMAGNLIASTLGNIVGGTLLVAGVYWVAYLRKGRG